MAMKKKAPAKKGASDKAIKAQSSRMKRQANQIEYDLWNKKEAASRRLGDEAYLRGIKPGFYEGGFFSEGIARKESLDWERQRVKDLQQAKAAMKSGVTKSGGYVGGKKLTRGAGGGFDITDLREARRSDKWKGDLAVKKTGSMTRNARGKTTKRNAK
jgi:hypothetical protein